MQPKYEEYFYINIKGLNEGYCLSKEVISPSIHCSLNHFQLFFIYTISYF